MHGLLQLLVVHHCAVPWSRSFGSAFDVCAETDTSFGDHWRTHHMFAVTYLIPNQTFLISFTESIFLLNLDQSFPSCFFDGMTMSTSFGDQCT